MKSQPAMKCPGWWGSPTTHDNGVVEGAMRGSRPRVFFCHFLILDDDKLVISKVISKKISGKTDGLIRVILFTVWLTPTHVFTFSNFIAQHKLRSKHKISKSNSQLFLSWLMFRKHYNLYQKIN